MDKTFAAIEKLKEIELELHRLKNALEMMNRAHEVKKEWVGISEEQYEYIRKTNGDDFYFFAYAIEQDLKEKNT